MTNAVKAPNPQRERQRKWYASLTTEQREARCIRQREAQRARRSRIKAGTYAGRNTVDPAASLEKRRKRQREWMSRKREQQKAEKAAAGAPASPLQPVSESAAPMAFQATRRRTAQACEVHEAEKRTCAASGMARERYRVFPGLLDGSRVRASDRRMV